MKHTLALTLALLLIGPVGGVLAAQAAANEASQAEALQALQSAATVKKFVKALPDWGTVYRVNAAIPKNRAKPVKRGVPSGVTRTHHDIYDAPDKIATFAPVDAFWLGAIVQGKGLSSLGTMQEVRVAAAKRAPFFITSTLPGAHSVQVTAPSAHAVEDALDAMRQAAKASGQTPVSVDSFHYTENYNAQQTATDLGLDVSYLNNDVQASLGVSHGQKEHTVTAAFIERVYTVSVDFGGASAHKAFFNDNFTVENAQKLVPKQISPDNLPAYVKSITYGRMLLFNLTSTASADDVKAALQAKFGGPVGPSGGVNLSHDQAAQKASFTLQVTQFGGPQTAFSKAVPASDTAAQPSSDDTGGTVQGLASVLATMQNYLSVPADPASMIPISYTINSLKEDKLATMAVTSSYDVDTYADNPVGANYKLHIWVTIDAIGHTSDPYDIYGTLTVDGTKWWEATPNNTVSGPMGATVEISNDPAHTTPAANDFMFEYLYAAPAPRQVVSLKLFQHGTFADYSLGSWSVTLGDPNNATELKQLWHDNSNHAVTMHLRVEKGAPIM